MKGVTIDNKLDEDVFKFTKNLVGGWMRKMVTGASPI